MTASGESPRAGFGTVGDLRRVIEDVDDSYYVCIEGSVNDDGALRYAFMQASDAVLLPVGTDVMEEATVGVLVLGTAADDPMTGTGIGSVHIDGPADG